MAELKEITAREANQRFSAVLAEVERGAEGFIVTKRGRPVARILPVERKPGLTPEQEAALARILSFSLPLGIGRFDRNEAYED